MNTRVFVVTGATGGIGKAVAHELAKTVGTVVMVARDDERGKQAQKEIVSATENPNVELQLCDLGNMSSVRNLAMILNNRYEKLDVLVNNASLYRKDRVVTVDGFESMFATNHLGPFLLTYLLLDRLMASDSARIINVTAPSTTPMDFDDLQSGKNFNSLSTFGATKMANLLFTYELARRMENTGVTVNAVHPGLVRSDLMKEAALPIRLLGWVLASPPSRAADHIVKLATDPEFEDTTGKFLHNGSAIEPDSYALDPANQLRLWEISEKLSRASEAEELGAEYDPTGSVAMFDDRDLPEGLVRPEDNQNK